MIKNKHKYFNGKKYYLKDGYWWSISIPHTKLSHDVWDFYCSNDPIRKGEVIHHIDGNKLNDDITNLEKMTDSEHKSLHQSGVDHSGKKNPMYGVHRIGTDNPNWKGGIKNKSLPLDNGTIETNCFYTVLQNINSLGEIQASCFGLMDRRKRLKTD